MYTLKHRLVNKTEKLSLKTHGGSVKTRLESLHGS